MRLLKKLFGPGAGKVLQPVDEAIADPVTYPGDRTVLDLFREDLSCIRLSSFTEGKAEVQANGDIIRNYCKILKHKEYGIFDTMYVRLIEGSINVVFKSSEPGDAGMYRMKEMIDDLYAIYGSDSSNKGRYGHADAAEYADEQFYALFGRDWMDYPRYAYPVTLRRYEEEVFISIWGLTHNNII